MNRKRTLWERTSGAGKLLIIVCFVSIITGIILSFKIEYINGLYEQVEIDIEYLVSGLKRAAFFCISLVLLIMWNFVSVCFNKRLENNKLETYLLILYTVINFGFLIYSTVSFLVQPRLFSY